MIHTRFTLVQRPLSGNCWKIRLCCSELGLAYEKVTPEDMGMARFAEVSRRSCVPVLLEHGCDPLIESVAILMRLARNSHLLPDQIESQILSWLVWDQAELSRALALPRFFRRQSEFESRTEEISQMHKVAHTGLAILEKRLDRHEWLVGDRYSLADLGCHVYILLAPEGGLDISRYRKVNDWLTRIQARPCWHHLCHKTLRKSRKPHALNGL